MRTAFFFDQTRCMGCNTCTVACKDTYDVNPGPVSYRKQKFHEEDDGFGVFYTLVMSCNHCKNPACMSACAAGAITKRSDGIVIVDRNKCRGLKTCITACPFAEPEIADDKQEQTRSDKWLIRHPMQKCNMCVTFMDKGELPVCIRACPAHAIDIGDYDELLAKHPEAEPLTPKKYPYAYVNNKTDTQPSLIIKPRRALKVTGNYK